MTSFDSVPFNNTQLLMRSSNTPVVGTRLKEHEFTSIVSATLQALSVNFFTKLLILCSSPPSSLRTHNFVNSKTSLFLQQGAQITGASSAEGLIFFCCCAQHFWVFQHGTFFHVTLLAPKVFISLPGFRKMCIPLSQPIRGRLQLTWLFIL